MDASKLPRLSNTDRPAAGDAQETGQPRPVDYMPPEPTGFVAAQAWISGILGLLVLLYSWRFGAWLLTTLTGGTYNTGVGWGPPLTANDPPQGTPVGYWELMSFSTLRAPDVAWTEMGLFLFGLAMVVEAVMLVASVRASVGMRRLTLLAALGLAAAAAIVNVGVLIYLISIGLALPILTFVAAAFAGYMAFYLWGEWSLHRRMPS